MRRKTEEGFKMKKILFASLVLVTVFILAQCASMQRWPTYERTAEDKMTAIQQKIGEGLKTVTLTPEQAQIFLAKLEDVRRDYLLLREKNVYRDAWESLLGRLDVLDSDVNRALARPPKVKIPPLEDRLIVLQRRIDDARTTRRVTLTEAREFQVRLDAIRSDYLRMTEGGRFIRYEDKAEITRRLDLLEIDINRYR